MRHLLLTALLIVGLAAHVAYKFISADDFVFDPATTLDRYRTQAIVAEERHPERLHAPMLLIAPPYIGPSSVDLMSASWDF